MNKHTPGPWGYEHNGAGDSTTACIRVFTVDRPYRGDIAYCQSSVHIGGISCEETETNAALIAAASDLLAALEVAEQMMLECVYIGDITEAGTACLAKIRAAIARAKGESL